MAAGMIERIIIKQYRCFKQLDTKPNPGINLVVGDNEAGKSTLLEAIHLGLTGRINGRWARDELNPFWFHQGSAASFFAAYGTPKTLPPPEIRIELYLGNADALQDLRGVHNSVGQDSPGVCISISLNSDYKTEFNEYMCSQPPAVLPTEFYKVSWSDFSGRELVARPKDLATAFIDARTVRSTSGIDFHTREMLGDHLTEQERAKISLAHRTARQDISDNALKPINERIAKANKELHDRRIGLQMDQSARASWEIGVVPQIDDIPFGMAGQGQQAAVKVTLAMNRTVGSATYVLIEEPENHLSYSTLNSLVTRIESLAGPSQQLFISTHSSFVSNRLGLDKILLLHSAEIAKLTDLPAETVGYFQKLSGYDTLRLVLASKLVLVEGPADDIIMQRAIKDVLKKEPAALGIDIMSMGGLAFKRSLQVCSILGRKVVAVRDNDGKTYQEIVDASELAQFLKPGTRDLIVSDHASGKTLEPQIVAANDPEKMRSVLGITRRADPETWMTNNKTEAALRILQSEDEIKLPAYILAAVELLR